MYEGRSDGNLILHIEPFLKHYDCRSILYFKKIEKEESVKRVRI